MEPAQTPRLREGTTELVEWESGVVHATRIPASGNQ